MAGTIAVAPQVRWSAAGWLFDLVVDILKERVDDPDTRADLDEIVEQGLGWVSVDDYPAPVAAALRQTLRDEVVAAADARLPESLANRDEALRLVRDLADLARRHAGPS